MAIAVIMPVFNEEVRVHDAVARLVAESYSEIVVVDGGSSDATAKLAEDAGARVLVCPQRGRGSQQNYGAARTSADTLLFVHADVVLPEHAEREIERTLDGPGVVAGAFRVRHVPERWRGLRRSHLLRLADLRSRCTSLPYGDQGLFLRRETFDRVGGFPDSPLMEDLEMGMRLRALGAIVVSGTEVRVSARRFESSPIYQTLLVNLFPSLYRLGVSPDVLARLYGNPR